MKNRAWVFILVSVMMILLDYVNMGHDNVKEDTVLEDDLYDINATMIKAPTK